MISQVKMVVVEQSKLDSVVDGLTDFLLQYDFKRSNNLLIVSTKGYFDYVQGLEQKIHIINNMVKIAAMNQFSYILIKLNQQNG